MDGGSSARYCFSVSESIEAAMVAGGAGAAAGSTVLCMRYECGLQLSGAWSFEDTRGRTLCTAAPWGKSQTPHQHQRPVRAARWRCHSGSVRKRTHTPWGRYALRIVVDGVPCLREASSATNKAMSSRLCGAVTLCNQAHHTRLLDLDQHTPSGPSPLTSRLATRRELFEDRMRREAMHRRMLYSRIDCPIHTYYNGSCPSSKPLELYPTGSPTTK
jgi:hypothetical protein